MRSDRNPYFILRKSKNAHVQHWLHEAAHMTIPQIEQTDVKPDLKKAMLFVATFGAQTRSAHTAEIMADLMTKNHECVRPSQWELWQYDQESFPIKCKGNNWIILNTPFVFLKDQHRAFVGHVWVNLKDSENQQLMNGAQQIGMGDHSVYNKITNQLIQKRHST